MNTTPHQPTGTPLARPYKQPWIGNPTVEKIFILLPPFFSLAIIAAFPHLFQNNGNMPDAGWVILILLIDVAHVYSTLYRTYFDRRSWEKFRVPLLLIPLLGFIGGTLLYWQDGLLFWRVLAYLAVFHFVRQQYGFMRIYSRSETIPLWGRRIDTFTIYYATLYPLIYWHLGEPRHFNWFVDDDFITFPSATLLKAATLLYYATITTYLTREIIQLLRTRHLNIPRVAILLGTILSWYFGIVYYNGDMAFTLLNVVSHGIPYMALIWLYGKKQVSAVPRGTSAPLLRAVFSRYGIILFLAIIFLLAYFEEGLWDMTVHHQQVRINSV
jgi:hypothetical protein